MADTKKTRKHTPKSIAKLIRAQAEKLNEYLAQAHEADLDVDIALEENDEGVVEVTVGEMKIVEVI